MGIMDFFRSREVKASSAGPMIVSNSAGQAQWTKRDLQLYARDGYQRNAVVYRCIRLIAESAASIPVMAMRGDREVEGHAALALLAKPTPFSTGKRLLASAYSFRLISGNAFLEVVTVGQSPRELYAHRPERFKVVPGGDGNPKAYRFSLNGREMDFDVDPVTGKSNVLHLMDFHPLDDWFGMSPLDPASFAVDAHTYASRETVTTLQKGGVPVGAFQYDGSEALTPDQGRQSKEMFRDNITDARRSRLPLFLNKFWKWVPFGYGPKELDVTNLKADAAREICFAYGVPPMLLGIPGDNTYANYAEANRAFWRDTVIPFAERNLEEIGGWLAMHYGEADLTLVPNTDNIIALETETAERWKRLNAADFITVNEKREAAGYGGTDGGDVVLVPSSNVPLEDAGSSIHGGAEPNDGADAEDQADAQDDTTQGAGNSGDRANSGS